MRLLLLAIGSLGLLAPTAHSAARNLQPAPAPAPAPPPPPGRYTSFHPAATWKDVQNRTIDAHGGGLFVDDDGATYWYGSQRHGHPNVAKHGVYPPYSAYCYPPPPDENVSTLTKIIKKILGSEDHLGQHTQPLPLTAKSPACVSRF